MPLTIESRRVGYITVIDCVGRLVAGEDSAALNSKVRSCIDNHVDVVVNLHGVSFIDSSGLGTLVRLAATTRHTPAGVRFCGANDQIRKVVELTNLSGTLQLHESEEQALRALGSATVPLKKPVQTSNGTILCLSDSMDLLSCLRESLDSAGFRTQTTRTVPDAILLIRTVRPSLAIADAQFTSRLAAVCSDLGTQIISLPDDFSTAEAGEAMDSLLEEIRRRLQQGHA